MEGAGLEQDTVQEPPDHHRVSPGNLQQRHQENSNHVTFHRVDYASDLALPVSLLGVTLVGLILVLVILVLWWRNHAPWRIKNDRKMDCGDFIVETSNDSPRIVENLIQTDTVSVKYVDESERFKLKVVTTRNYGGSSPKVLEEEKEEEKQFVFPPEDKEGSPQAGSSGSSEKAFEQKKFKILLPQQTWLSKKPYEPKPYRATIPRQLAEVFKTELGDDLNIQERTKKFSATRSPSLEKDDKSPFVSSATYDKSDVFAFEPDKIKRFSTGNNSPVVEMKVEPQSRHGVNVLDRNFNNNVTPMSPKVSQDSRKPPNIEHLRTSSLDADSENKERQEASLRRFRSVNTKLNICSTADVSIEIQQERSEMQNSPRILECSSATEKSSKFNFSPKLLGENQISPKFFTPTDKFSPRFFPEGSPKSVYYDSIRSPKFFPDSPKSPAIQEERTLSPKAFTDQNMNSPRNSPKLFAIEQHSPRILSGKPRSPKVYSANKENYFDFDGKPASTELTRVDEIDNALVIQKPSYIRRYGGRKSIEQERVNATEKLDIRRYRRHNSCETYNQNVDNGNAIIATTANDNDEANGHTRLKGTVGEDVLDCCLQVESMKISPTREEKPDTLKPNTQTAQQRRQRLKSISLDSDNARIIEQNLGLPIAKHMKQDNLDELQDYSSSCCNVIRSETCETGGETKFTFDRVEISKVESKDYFTDESKYSPDLNAPKKSLKDASDTKSFIDMPRFSPKEFEVIITVDDDEGASAKKRKVNRNPRNLTIDLTRKDSDLEKELLEFEKLYTNTGDKKVRTPTLKIKAISLDSSESMNLSLPPLKALEVPQNSVSVPNTPKRHLRILAQKNLVRGSEMHSGGKMGYNSLQSEQRRFMKWQPVHLDSGIFLKENHANLMLYQPSTSRANTRRMGSFDENMADFAENPPEINVNDCDDLSNLHQGVSSQFGNLGSNLLSFKQNLSVSSTNLKTLPENVPSNNFETTVKEKVTKKLNRKGSNQSLKLSLDQVGKYSTYSLQSSNCSLSSAGVSCHNLASLKNSASNFSLNTDNRQKILERRNSNTSLSLASDHNNRSIGSNVNFQASNTNISGDGQSQPAKNCLLQRRGSNNSLTLNIQNSSTTLARFSSNSSLNINKDVKSCHRKGLLERRSSNTSLTLNINSSNPHLATNRGLSISNYNLNGSTCNLNIHSSNQNICNPSEPKKGILERRSSNTSLTINIQNPEVPRDIELDEKLLESNIKDQQFILQRDKHRKSLSTENLIPKSYKNRTQTIKNKEIIAGFGSQDNLWSNYYVEEALQESCGENLTYVGGDPENELIYAFGMRQNLEEGPRSVRNITTKPLSPQTTSEDFKTYLANIQHLQNASSVLTRKQLKDLNNVFQNGYSKVKCDGSDENGHRCSPRDPSTESSHITFPETELPCYEYQKLLLRNLHKEFWDLPSNFQEKPMVFGSHPKNRYKTILPNEHSRFILRSDIADAGEGYVNANFIKGHDYTKNSYIATQGPLQNTIYDFWSMVHQNSSVFSERNLGARPKVDRVDSKVNRKVSVHGDSPKIQKIVMLTNFIENNRQKCEKYFPTNVGEEMVFVNPEVAGDVFTDAAVESDNRNSFLIKNKGIIKNMGYTISRLQVCYRRAPEQLAPSSESHKHYEKTDIEVYHYWFHNWADHKCPKDVNALLSLSLDVLSNCTYDFVTSDPDSGKCKSISKTDSETTKFVFPPEEAVASSLPKPFSSIDFDDEGVPPTIVHCSAGIGRTGCLIAILNAIKQLSYDQKVDILGIVCNMRLNRGGMVQTSEQYELVHKVMCLYEQICLPSL